MFGKDKNCPPNTMGNTKRGRHGQRCKNIYCKAGKEEQLSFSPLVPFLYLHMGESFGIRLLSLLGLSLKSKGSSTVTQHGVQKMSTRTNKLPKLRKRKRRELQKQ